MKNGNASLLRWLHLCVFLLAILPTLKAASATFPTSNNSSVTFTISFFVESGSLKSTATWTYNGTAGWYGLRANVFKEGSTNFLGSCGQANALYPSDTTSGASYTYTKNYGSPASGRYSVIVEWNSCQSVVGGTIIFDTITWDGTTATSDKDSEKTVNVSLTLVNNKNATETITASVGGTTKQTWTLSPSATQTFTFTATGKQGTAIGFESSPDGITWDSNYDPAIISQNGEAITRSGYIGQPPQKVRVRVVVISYSTSTVSIPVQLDGTAIGSVLAAGSNGKTPSQVSYDYEVNLSESSTLNFPAPTGHTVAINANNQKDLWVYTLIVDQGATTNQDSLSVSSPSADGTVTTTATDTTTGTTTITRSTPTTPTNTNTTPSGAFGSGSGVTNTGASYGNTSSAAGSAASQDMSNSLAAIERNTRDTADNTAAVGVAAKDSRIGTAAGQATLTDLMKNGPANGVQFGQDAAAQAQGKASDAYSAFGALPSTPSAPDAAPDPSIELNIGPGKTVKMYLNPFSSNGPMGGMMSAAAAFVRRLIAWGLVATFFIWCAGRIREMVAKPFATAPLGDSLAQSINSVKIAGFGGGLGWAVKIVAYGLILTIILTMPLVVMAAITAGLPWAELVSVWSAGPGTGAGVVSQAVSMANQVVPWGMLVSAPIWYFTVEFILFPSQFFWMVFVKFLPV